MGGSAPGPIRFRRMVSRLSCMSTLPDGCDGHRTNMGRENVGWCLYEKGADMRLNGMRYWLCFGLRAGDGGFGSLSACRGILRASGPVCPPRSRPCTYDHCAPMNRMRQGPAPHLRSPSARKIARSVAAPGTRLPQRTLVKVNLSILQVKRRHRKAHIRTYRMPMAISRTTRLAVLRHGNQLALFIGKAEYLLAMTIMVIA